jgi:phospholipid/cholesterol/gamma-HCH transport system substrate-binding protein
MGKKSGKISAIDLDAENPEEIVVTLEVETSVPIKASTTARISSSSILGTSYVELFGSRRDSPELPPLSEIPAAPSALSRILRAGETLGDQLVTVLNNLQSWTTPERREAFWGAVDDFRTALQSVDESIDRVVPVLEGTLQSWRDVGVTLNSVMIENRETGERLLRDLAQSADRLRTFLAAGELEEISEVFRRSLETLTQEIQSDGAAFRGWLERNDLAPHVQQAALSLEGVAQDFRRIAVVIETQTVALTQGDLAPVFRELRGAAEALSRTLESIQRNPRALFFGSPPPEKPLPGGAGERR